MLESRVRAAIERNRMFQPGDLVVVAVSGGPDSVALLHVLAALAPELSLRLHAAHLDHRLRGHQSDEDARSVQRLATDLGVPVIVAARDVLSLQAERHLGLEEAARVARYSFLAEVTGQLGAAGVAVGHTADDQVETVIMHWLRGSGLAGLRGMQPVSLLHFGAGRECEALRVFRPLLEVPRADVLSYCQQAGLPTRQDSSNADRRFLRNRVRLDLLPVLERYNPGIRGAVQRTARLAADDLSYLDAQAQEAWGSVATARDSEVSFDLAGWVVLAPSLQRLLLREAIERVCGGLIDISATHIEAALVTVAQRPAGATVVWPQGLRLVKRYHDFIVTQRAQVSSGLTVEGLPLTIPGETVVAGGRWTIRAWLSDTPCFDRQAPWHASLDHAAVGSELIVRRRRPGDRFRPMGMNWEKKLQDFLVDSQVPREERDAVPIIASPKQIVWVAGQRIDDRVKVTKETGKVLCLTVSAREE